MKQSYFERDTFELWTKEKLKIGLIGKHGAMKFKVLKCRYLKEQKCYAILCLWLKKIAMLIPTFYQWSGPDRLAEQKAIEASNIGHNVTVFTSEASIK